jgi:hypothetical protein
MQTKRVKVYSFTELSEQAKQTAIQNHRQHLDTSYIYEDAHGSVKAFHNIFNTKEGRDNWLDIRTGHIDDNILQISGTRLLSYLWNNYGKDLYKGKYYNVKSNYPLKHRRVESTTYKNGNTHNAYRSAVQLEHSCVLTGICYDDSLLNPIYKFLDEFTPADTTTTFEDLITDCFHNLKKDIETEEEYLNSDECITEELLEQDNEFLADGTLFNL